MDVWKSLKEDHSYEALSVWSDFFRDQGEESLANCLIWMRDNKRWMIRAHQSFSSQGKWLWCLVEVGWAVETRMKWPHSLSKEIHLALKGESLIHPLPLSTPNPPRDFIIYKTQKEAIEDLAQALEKVGIFKEK